MRITKILRWFTLPKIAIICAIIGMFIINHYYSFIPLIFGFIFSDKFGLIRPHPFTDEVWQQTEFLDIGGQYQSSFKQDGGNLRYQIDYSGGPPLATVAFEGIYQKSITKDCIISCRIKTPSKVAEEFLHLPYLAVVDDPANFNFYILNKPLFYVVPQYLTNGNLNVRNTYWNGSDLMNWSVDIPGYHDIDVKIEVSGTTFTGFYKKASDSIWITMGSYNDGGLMAQNKYPILWTAMTTPNNPGSFSLYWKDFYVEEQTNPNGPPLEFIGNGYNMDNRGLIGHLRNEGPLKFNNIHSLRIDSFNNLDYLEFLDIDFIRFGYNRRCEGSFINGRTTGKTGIESLYPLNKWRYYVDDITKAYGWNKSIVSFCDASECPENLKLGQLPHEGNVDDSNNLNAFEPIVPKDDELSTISTAQIRPVMRSSIRPGVG